MKPLFFALPVIYICANAYLFARTLQAISDLPIWLKAIISILFWLLAFALFIAIGFRESHLPEFLTRALFNAGAVWCVFLLYSVIFLAIADIAKFAIPNMGHSFWYALTLSSILLAYGYINYRNPKIEHINVSFDSKSYNDNLRIVAISDIHLGYGTGVKRLQNYVNLINAQKPDVLLITGDLIDNSIKPILNDNFDEVLSTIKAPLGIYMVPGNHEYISNIDKVSEYLKRTPIVLLRDSIVTLPNGIQIIGRDDRSNHRRKPLEDLITQTDTNQPTIVLDHQPYKLAKADSLNVDMLLCGHTHHGQVFPFNLITNRLYEQSHGYRKWNHSHIWVSSGLSLWGPPFRIGTHSDFAVIDLAKPKNK